MTLTEILPAVLQLSSPELHFCRQDAARNGGVLSEWIDRKPANVRVLAMMTPMSKGLWASFQECGSRLRRVIP